MDRPQRRVRRRVGRDGGTISRSERGEILADELAWYSRKGFRVTSQAETTAQVVKGKSVSAIGAALILLLTLGSIFVLGPGALCVLLAGAVLLVLDYALKKERSVYLQVNDYGEVLRNGGSRADAPSILIYLGIMGAIIVVIAVIALASRG